MVRRDTNNVNTIDITERPYRIARLISWDTKSWLSFRKIRYALLDENVRRLIQENAVEGTPDDYPAGTVAEIKDLDVGRLCYVIKQDDGCWRELDTSFEIVSMPSLFDFNRGLFAFTVLYNPDNDQ